MKNDVAGGNGIMTADEMYAVYDGVTYALESVMPKTGLAALKKNEHGKTIIFNVPKSEITAAWLIHKIPIYGKLRCDNITLSGSRCFITASVMVKIEPFIPLRLTYNVAGLVSANFIFFHRSSRTAPISQSAILESSCQWIVSC